MVYVLEAVVAPDDVADALARSSWPDRVRLPARVWLFPITGRQTPILVGDGIPESLASVLEDVSKLGTTAYVEAAFHGGDGEQACAVWSGGRLVLGPLAAEVAPARLTEGPINQALRRLGVAVANGAADEFDTVGLGRCRSTEEWLDLAKREPR